MSIAELSIFRRIPSQSRDAFSRDAVASLLFGLFSGATTPFIAFIARDRLHASPTMIALLTSAPFLGLLLTTPYAGLTAGKRPLSCTVWPYVISRGIFLLAFLARSAEAFTLMVCVMWVAGSLPSASYAEVMREIYPTSHRGALMSYIRVGMAFATLVATQSAGLLLKDHALPYQGIFTIAAAIGLASVAVFSSIRSDTRSSANELSGAAHAAQVIGLLREDRDFAWFMLGTFVFGFGNICFITIMPIYQVDRLHITASQVAILSNISSVVWMLSFPFWGRYVDRRSPVMATVLSIALITLLPINFWFARNPWMLIPYAIVNGTAMASLEMAYFNSIIYFAGRGDLSRYQSLHALAGGVRGLIAPFCASALIPIFRSAGVDLRSSFPLFAAVIALGGVVVVAGLKHHLSRASRA